MTISKKITTKKKCSGEYDVFVNNVFAGTITNGSLESREWSAFDSNNDWIQTMELKRDVLRFF